MAWYLVQYDITDKKRLQRVHRFMKSCAFSLQGSVFAWRGNDEALRQFQHKLASLIDTKADDIRGYALKNAVWLFGDTPFVRDVYFGGYPPHVNCALSKLMDVAINSGEGYYELADLLRH